MSYYIQRYKDRDEWLKGRAEGLGSSEVGTILGVNHFDTPLRLWRRKVGLDKPQGESAAMKRGHRVEIVVANDFAEATGAIIDPGSVEDWHAVDVDRPYLRVSPDRLWWPEGTPKAEQTPENAFILECKTCQASVDAKTVFEVYPYWYCQVQYQMGVMGIRRCAVAWINVKNPDLPFDYTMVEFNSNYYHRTMLPALEHFWNDCIVGGLQPDEVIDEEDAKLMFAPVEDSSVTATQEIEELCYRFQRLKAHVAEMEKEMKDIELECRKALGNNETLKGPSGLTLATFKTYISKGSFDKERFRTENKELYDEYVTEPTETKRFTMKTLRI